MNHPKPSAHGVRAAPIFALIFATASCGPEIARDSFHEATKSPLERPVASPSLDREWFVYPLGTDDQLVDSRFGLDVALSGNTAVVGAPNGLAAYVFVLTDSGWEQQAKLVPPTALEQGSFGSSVAISGDTIVVGAPTPIGDQSRPGAVYVYVRSGPSWGAPLPLEADDGIDGDHFGHAVALEDDTLVVGATQALGPTEYDIAFGAAYVFTRSGSDWSQVGKLRASDAGSYNEFGGALALSGRTVLVGSSNAPFANQQGAAYLFTRAATDWNDCDEDKLEPPAGLRDAEFGHSVALHNDVAVVGAHHDAEVSGDRPYRAGRAFVYTRSSTGWSLAKKPLLAGDPMQFDAFGSSVSISGTSVMVGSPGAASVYLFDPFTSTTASERIGMRGRRAFMGASLELDGEIAVVGTDYGQNGAYALELRSPIQGACETNLGCGSRHCSRGVCCQTACTGACETCASGTCEPLAFEAGTPSCAPYVCGESGGDCPSRCTASAQCVDTHYCRSGRCVERVPNGSACGEGRDCVSGSCIDGACIGDLDIGERCANAEDCQSGFCVDGFCCDQRCDGQCEACDVRGSRGDCSPVEGAPHGERTPCAGADTRCGGECDGEHTVACVYPSGDVACGTSCSDAALTESFCNGRGDCEPSDPRSCGNLLCAGETTCKTDCDDSDDCVAGTTCQDNHECEPRSTCLDEDTSLKIDRTTEECAPLLCRDGSCMKRCVRTEDCSGKTVCDDGRCVPPPARSGSSGTDGGGCSMAPGSSNGYGRLLALGLVLVCRALRARRSKRTNATIGHAPPKRFGAETVDAGVVLRMAERG